MSVWSLNGDEEELTEPKWQNQSQSDVADSAYRAARQALIKPIRPSFER